MLLSLPQSLPLLLPLSQLQLQSPGEQGESPSQLQSPAPSSSWLQPTSTEKGVLHLRCSLLLLLYLSCSLLLLLPLSKSASSHYPTQLQSSSPSQLQSNPSPLHLISSLTLPSSLSQLQSQAPRSSSCRCRCRCCFFIIFFFLCFSVFCFACFLCCLSRIIISFSLAIANCIEPTAAAAAAATWPRKKETVKQ